MTYTTKLRRSLKNVPVLGALAVAVSRRVRAFTFPGSENYWNRRYQNGDNSGAGSYGKLATFKADIINKFVLEHGVQSVIEHGCGDGNQLQLARYPSYLGLDVSPTAVRLCEGTFKGDTTKAFGLVRDHPNPSAELALSLDVIYHLIEDDVFNDYMTRLFSSATRFVIIYSSNIDAKAEDQALHVRHREFGRWIKASAPRWNLIGHVPNRYPLRQGSQEGSFADFFFYRRD